MPNYSRGVYQIINKDKYVGNRAPRWRSSWERDFMYRLDINPNVIQWASESIIIPYMHPFTGKVTNYIPDFFVQYRSPKNTLISELIEIKPRKQSLIEGKMSTRDRVVVAINHFKWQAAEAWCKKVGIKFRVITEEDLYHQGSKK